MNSFGTMSFLRPSNELIDQGVASVPTGPCTPPPYEHLGYEATPPPLSTPASLPESSASSGDVYETLPLAKRRYMTNYETGKREKVVMKWVKEQEVEIKKAVRKALKQEMKQELKQELKLELKDELEKELKRELNEELEQELKSSLEKSIQKVYVEFGAEVSDLSNKLLEAQKDHNQLCTKLELLGVAQSREQHTREASSEPTDLLNEANAVDVPKKARRKSRPTPAKASYIVEIYLFNPAAEADSDVQWMHIKDEEFPAATNVRQFEQKLGKSLKEQDLNSPLFDHRTKIQNLEVMDGLEMKDGPSMALSAWWDEVKERSADSKGRELPLCRCYVFDRSDEVRAIETI